MIIYTYIKETKNRKITKKKETKEKKNQLTCSELYRL